MQLKPAFSSYKILESYPLFKDDDNNEFRLAKLKGIQPHEGYSYSTDYTSFVELANKEEVILYTVLGTKQEKWSNGALSLSSVAFYNRNIFEKNDFFKGEINGFFIVEVYDGYHYIFKPALKKTGEDYGVYHQNNISPYHTIRTKFMIKKLIN